MIDQNRSLGGRVAMRLGLKLFELQASRQFNSAITAPNPCRDHCLGSTPAAYARHESPRFLKAASRRIKLGLMVKRGAQCQLPMIIKQWQKNAFGVRKKPKPTVSATAILN